MCQTGSNQSCVELIKIAASAQGATTLKQHFCRQFSSVCPVWCRLSIVVCGNFQRRHVVRSSLTLVKSKEQIEGIHSQNWERIVRKKKMETRRSLRIKEKIKHDKEESSLESESDSNSENRKNEDNGKQKSSKEELILLKLKNIMKYICQWQ